MLPKGQFDIGDMPRFGLPKFSNRAPRQTDFLEIKISGDVVREITIEDEFSKLPFGRVVADFHCVTTWSSRNLTWEGVLFRDLFERLIQPFAIPSEQALFIVLKAQDGAKASMQLRDLLNNNVILATKLNGERLSEARGAPVRLVAPDHYGYKNVKHLASISFHVENSNYKPSGFWFMEHPRARVAYEERGKLLPGWILRYAYRPLIKPTVELFSKASVERSENS